MVYNDTYKFVVAFNKNLEIGKAMMPSLIHVLG